MRKFLLLFFIFLTYTFSYAQAGAGPFQSCTQAIPEICNGSLYPAATSGTATAPFGANFNCGFTSVSENASFYYFVSSTNGPLNINITPTDFLGIPYPNIGSSPDLDFKCWGPFNDILTMCDQLTNANQEDCSTAPATTAEVITIANAVAGQIYVVLVQNWAATGTSPDPCYIQFTPVGPNDAFGGPNPGDAGGTVGIPTPLLFCDTDPSINLIDILNGTPLNWGYWTFAGDTVTGTFDPATGPGGTYTYTIPGTVNCPSDIAYAVVDIFSAATISVTSPSVICSNENSFTLSGIPPVGFSAQGQGVFTNSTGTIITDFDPVTSGPGTYNITYTYTPTGCNPIPVPSSILVNPAPNVLAANIIVNNPSCYGFTDGSAILSASGGTPPYVFNWYGQNPLQLAAGVFNYTVTDDNLCSYSSSVSLYNPLNTTFTINEYNSSCFGTNDGAASVTVFGGSTPPGTASPGGYCPSNPAPSLNAQAATIIANVQLTGDAFNISNSTAGVNDFYQDYTPTMYADLTQGGIYTVSVTPSDISATASYAPQKINVYIDFNIDGDFVDLGEDLGVISIPWGSWAAGTVYPFNFTVPTTGAFGATRMRVVCMSNANSPIFPIPVMGPCIAATGTNSPYFGATEDYSIVLNSPATTATFLWGNGSNADSIANLAPGTYSIIVTVGGCPAQDFAVITEPSEIVFNPTITDISCNSFTDGAVSLNISGGNGGAYTQNWYGQNPSALGSGSYNVTVSDPTTITATNLVACANDTTIMIVEPAYFSVDFTTSDNEICLNDPVSLDFDFNQGGFAPFTINYTVNALPQIAGPINSTGVNNIAVSPSLGNNTYIITSIVDANGCTHQNNINPQNIFVNPLPDINITVLPNPICVGDDATLLFTAPSGTPPYAVDYTVAGVVASANVPGAGLPLLVNPTTSTTYALTYVTDSKGCAFPLADNTTLIVNEIPQASFTSASETCVGDIIDLQFDFTVGAAPWFVNYSVNGVATSISFNNNISSIAISPQSASVYTITSITDNNNCQNIVPQTLTITVNPLPQIVLSGGGSICIDSTTNIIFTTTSGTPPYNLTYSAGLISNSVSNIGNIYTVASNQNGVYSIQDVTDSKGCKATSISGSAYVNVNPLPEANITAYPQPADITNPQISFIDLSTGHVDGLWNFGDGGTALTNFDRLFHNFSDTGTFQVSLSIVSDSGCTDIAYLAIYISPTFTIYVPNAFTPNNDLDNDYFLPIVDGVSEYEFSVYTRLGQRVFTTNDFSNDYQKCIYGCTASWDGKINNGTEYAIADAYVYFINLTDFNGKLRTFEGTVTLIR